MYTVYVLYSEKYKKIYIGYSGDFQERFISHNVLGKKGWTIKFRPWKILYTEEYETKADALKREKELKSAQGRAFIWNIVKEKFP